MQSNQSESYLSLKEDGNNLFRKGDYQKAIEAYLKALKLSENDAKCNKEEKGNLYKNLSATYLKLNDYDKAVTNATSALELCPNDIKALYRRSQAFQAIGKHNEAFKDALAVQHLDPKNKTIEPVLRDLNAKLQEIAKQNATTTSKVTQMLKYLTQKDVDLDKKLQAGNNLIVLARDKGSAKLIIESNGLQILLSIFKSKCDSRIKISCVRCLGELCKNDVESSIKVLDVIGIDFLIDFLKELNDEEFITSIQYVIQTIIDSLAGYDHKHDEKPNPVLLKANENHLDKIMTSLVKSSSSRIISALSRDAILELIIRNVDYNVLNWGKKLVDMDGLENLLDIASELEDIKYESSMNITSNTRTHISLALDRAYFCMDNDIMRENFREKVMEFINNKLKGADIEDKVRATATITALLQGPIEIGNNCLGQQGVIEMMLVMAGSDDEVQQRVAAEAIIAAANKKDKCQSLASMGGNILKNLYKSNNESIKVRALVGLCKLGSFGGTDASVRPFPEDAYPKLTAACRKFLVDPSKDKDLKKWAAEGLAYLTLDADIKEELIADTKALSALIQLAQSGDLSVLYGVVTTFVNLTNSYEKQEVLPEMIELAKFAKQHIPEEHPKDDKKYIDERCKVLCQMEVITALVALSKTESKTSREMISRVFNSICENKELRGTVVQQGGAKALIKLALESNTDKGKKIAAQALARIGITINPEVAFPGQRCVEVVRPIMALLHPECEGLQNFEALMSLTNLAQVSPSVRTRILKDDGFSKIELYMFEDHEMIKRAAVQCMSNLILCEEAVRLYEVENDRVKYLVLLSEDDDLDTAKAASGALAMLTSVSKISCEKFFQAKDWCTILLQLVSSKDKELQHRGVVIIYNLIDSDEKVAEKVVETKILEVLMAIVRPEVDDINEKVKEIALNALKRAEEQKLIKPFNGETDQIHE